MFGQIIFSSWLLLKGITLLGLGLGPTATPRTPLCHFQVTWITEGPLSDYLVDLPLAVILLPRVSTFLFTVTFARQTNSRRLDVIYESRGPKQVHFLFRGKKKKVRLNAYFTWTSQSVCFFSPQHQRLNHN